MKYKHMYALHELRMWIVQVVIPGIIGAVALWRIPAVRNWLQRQKWKIDMKIASIKASIQAKKNKT